MFSGHLEHVVNGERGTELGARGSDTPAIQNTHSLGAF